MAIIHLEGMKFYAFHGHFPVEQSVGNEFIVDIKIETDHKSAAETDNLDNAVNYQLVYNTVKEEMTQVSHLLENVAERILKSLKSKYPAILHAEIKISKINPSLGGEIRSVSIIAAE